MTVTPLPLVRPAPVEAAPGTPAPTAPSDEFTTLVAAALGALGTPAAPGPAGPAAGTGTATVATDATGDAKDSAGVDPGSLTSGLPDAAACAAVGLAVPLPATVTPSEPATAAADTAPGAASNVDGAGVVAGANVSVGTDVVPQRSTGHIRPAEAPATTSAAPAAGATTPGGTAASPGTSSRGANVTHEAAVVLTDSTGNIRPPDAAAVRPATAAPAPQSSATSTPAAHVTRQVFPEVTSLVSRGNGSHRITLTLHPEALGEVRVAMTVRDGAVHVRLTGGPEASRALADGSGELGRLLQLAGATDARVVVHDQSGSTVAQQAPTADNSGLAGDRSGAGSSGTNSGPDSGPDSGQRHRDPSYDAPTPTDPAPATSPRPDPATRTRTSGVDVTV